MAENEAMMAPMTKPLGAIMPAVNRHQRHDNAETDEVNEDRQENDEQRWLAIHSYVNLNVKF